MPWYQQNNLAVQARSQVREVEPSLLPRSQRVGSGRRLQACQLLEANSDIRARATASMQLPCSAAQQTASTCYRSAQGLYQWHGLPWPCIVCLLQGHRGWRWDDDWKVTMTTPLGWVQACAMLAWQSDTLGNGMLLWRMPKVSCFLLVQQQTR